MEKYLYLTLDLATLLLPSISFAITQKIDPGLRGIVKWKNMIKGILFVGAIFSIWDIFFTKWGVWGFTKRYVTGIYLGNLPIEEWLFFLIIPFACMFIYEGTNYLIKTKLSLQTSKVISLVLSIILLTTGIFAIDNLYTSTTFLSTTVLLWVHIFVLKSNYLGKFYVGYITSLIPFSVVNGILTGSFIPEQVVWYNNQENLSFRIFTIPVEDSIYLLLLLLSVVTIYEGK